MNDGDRNAIARVETKVELGFLSIEARMKRMEEKVYLGNGQKSLLVRTAEVENAIAELNEQFDERHLDAQSAAMRRSTLISALIGAATIVAVAILV